jgi:hypothetical protein
MAATSMSSSIRRPARSRSRIPDCRESREILGGGLRLAAFFQERVPMTMSTTEGARLVGDEIGTRAVLTALLSHILVQEAKWSASLDGIKSAIDHHISEAQIPSSPDFDREDVRRAAAEFATSIMAAARSKLENAGESGELPDA